MADPAEVRAWARGEGMEVSARGAIPAYITEAYEAAHDPEHPVDMVIYGPNGDGSDAGVTEADFPPSLEGGGETGSPAPKAERKPRAVRPPRKTTKARWRQLFDINERATAKARSKRSSGPRTDLSEFAEDTWRDLAMLSAGIMPPVSRVLTIQAPYAGVVFDEAVRGLPLVDAVLQPIARASVSLRALNGLLGPAFFTTAITVQGQWATREDGSLILGDDGRPVPTPRTAMMLGGLKYSLLQMSRTADLDKVQERAELDAERMRKVDQLVDFIFAFPGPQQAPDQARPEPTHPAGPHMPPPERVLVPTMTYPPPPQMDDTGARL